MELRQQINEFLQRYKTNTRANYIKVAAIVFGVMFAIANSLYLNHFINMPVPHIALIKIEGAIERGSETGDGNILSEAIKSAMDNDLAHAILIEANSPGGSPVQSEILHRTIMEMRDTTHKPIYLTIGETCASACLYIASAADMLFAHKNSVIGSIGVRMDGWGFNKLIADLDIERRTYSAGEFKTLLAPFKARDPEAEKHIQEHLLNPLYQEFVNALKEGRGSKLATTNPKLFTGLIWTGTQAVELGLVDQIKTHFQVRQALLAQYDVEKLQEYNRANFSISKLLTSDFLGEAIATAFLKVKTESHVQVYY